MSAKDFEAVEKCCKKKCFQNVKIDAQRDVFNQFYNLIGEMDGQNHYLSKCMEKVTIMIYFIKHFKSNLHMAFMSIVNIIIVNSIFKLSGTF